MKSRELSGLQHQDEWSFMYVYMKNGALWIVLKMINRTCDKELMKMGNDMVQMLVLFGAYRTILVQRAALIGDLFIFAIEPAEATGHKPRMNLLDYLI